MLHVDPLKSSCSQKLQHIERKLRLQVLQKSNSFKQVVVLKVIFANANVYNCTSEKFIVLNE